MATGPGGGGTAVQSSGFAAALSRSPAHVSMNGRRVNVFVSVDREVMCRILNERQSFSRFFHSHLKMQELFFARGSSEQAPAMH